MSHKGSVSLDGHTLDEDEDGTVSIPEQSGETTAPSLIPMVSPGSVESTVSIETVRPTNTAATTGISLFVELIMTIIVQFLRRPQMFCGVRCCADSQVLLQRCNTFLWAHRSSNSRFLQQYRLKFLQHQSHGSDHRPLLRSPPHLSISHLVLSRNCVLLYND